MNVDLQESRPWDSDGEVLVSDRDRHSTLAKFDIVSFYSTKICIKTFDNMKLTCA